MIEFVKALQEKGFAYEISDGIYYDVNGDGVIDTGDLLLLRQMMRQ